MYPHGGETSNTFVASIPECEFPNDTALSEG